MLTKSASYYLSDSQPTIVCLHPAETTIAANYNDLFFAADANHVTVLMLLNL